MIKICDPLQCQKAQPSAGQLQSEDLRSMGLEEWKSVMKYLKIIKIIDRMAKKFKKTQKPCQSHLFSLKPDSKQHSSTRSLNLTLSFCSRNAEGSADAQEELKCIEAPIYNNDRSFASPAFTLPCDKSYYSQRRDKMLNEHELRYTYYSDQKTELNVPKPKSKNCYCSVCRQYYEDYLDHVTSAAHKNKVATSSFSKHIQELTRTFNKHRSLKNPFCQSKTLLDKSIIIEDVSDNSDEVEIISNPYKKIKTNDTNTAKDSNQCPTLNTKNTQMDQPYYPFSAFSAWHNTYFNPHPMAATFPLNFNFNFTINPFGFGQNMTQASPQVPSTGFQPFCINGQSFNMYGYGALPEV